MQDARLAARQLGYLLFWCFRGKHSANNIVLDRQDVIACIQQAGIKQPQTAWNLLDRNGDGDLSLEEVVNAVQEV